MKIFLIVKLLTAAGFGYFAEARLTRSTTDFGLLEPQFLPGTITTLIQTARKIIGANVEPVSVIGEGVSQTSQKDPEKLYNEALSSAVSVYQKAMNDATHNRLKQRDVVSSMPVVEPARDPVCSVMINGELALAIDPRNLFDVDLLGVKITKDDFMFMTDLRNPESIVRSFSLSKIEVPLESVQNSRKCFRMYFEGSPVVMCAKSDQERNEMMNKLTEAVSLAPNYRINFGLLVSQVFCKNSGISFSKTRGNIENTGLADSSLGVPALTTKDLRWIEQIAKRQIQMAGSVQSNVVNWLKSKGTQHVVVKDSLGFNPQITVNGEKVL
ncbi:PH domain-like protein [Cryptosporidium felis]|nr:PH domain-like protein [Cryptosporidium felis]